MASKPTIGGTNSLGVRYVTAGPPGLRAKLNEIIRSFDYLFPRPSADIIPEVTPGGALHRLRQAQPTVRATPAAATPLHPFQFTLAGSDKVRFYVGYVNGIIPTIGGVSLADATPPELTTGTTNLEAYLEVQYDSAWAVTAIPIISGVAPASVIDFATPANTRIRVQIVENTRALPRQVLYNNVSVAPSYYGAMVTAR
jgi:hypothetical protein